MEIKYLVKGIVKNNIIIRGLLFRVGADINLAIYEEELQFIKDNCEIISISNYDNNETNTLDKMLDNNNNGGIKNELPTKRNRITKGKNKTTI